MKRLTILATLLFAAVSVSAQDYHIKLWDNATAPTSNGVTGDEYERKPGTLTNTSSAEIWIYKPAPEKATGQAIVFCPGGGYSQLSIANGHNTCKWFAENGIVGVMLKYRLPNGHSEVPLNDLDKAVATVREMAGELGVDPHKVGVAGTSAGGYLAGRRCKKNGLLNGLFLGVLYFLILWLLSAIGGASIVPVLTKLPYILLAPMIGGILGVK